MIFNKNKKETNISGTEEPPACSWHRPSPKPSRHFLVVVNTSDPDNPIFRRSFLKTPLSGIPMLAKNICHYLLYRTSSVSNYKVFKRLGKGGQFTALVIAEFVIITRMEISKHACPWAIMLSNFVSSSDSVVEVEKIQSGEFLFPSVLIYTLLLMPLLYNISDNTDNSFIKIISFF